VYIPKLYKELDPETIAEFIRSNEFATLVSFDGERPVATHLLLGLESTDGNSMVLSGHMARANQQWHSFSAAQDVLAIFAGPHTYVSPRWYNHVNVPTWNYIAVHAYGRPRVITDHDELYRLLKKLVDEHEADSGAMPAYRLETLPEDFRERQMQAIVGFQIDVTRIEASYKLSQNRDQQSYDNVVTELYRRADDNSQAVADSMKSRRSKVFGADQ
jgi:transcriptional regulator